MGQNRTVFHVVCYDCPEEAVLETQTDAQVRASVHAEAADHRVEYDQIE